MSISIKLEETKVEDLTITTVSENIERSKWEELKRMNFE